ncbi:probable tubulin polyglutamylase TTLL2 isoform X1 [Aricia agestis]|uniref:probable tubulin polyglutamylase TTLL2 isoform X1 n=1 Tax=Aricia agestis TaxID=91739 RepID=UPI001C20ABA3|nr:probable tubulin polyglutamylase TTLL2 isoform X1 [Aricia agestis]
MGQCDDDPFVYRLNENGFGPSLLIKVCAERGWRIYQAAGGDDKWNLWWRNSAFPSTYYKCLGDMQFMNHIPKGGSICRKDNLSRLLRCMRRIYGSIYDFSPPCFHLPLEYAKLVSECSRLQHDGGRAVWIHKPVAQSQGRGIFLFRNVCEMQCGSPAVVQRYIERPLLVAGYKFDLRLYVCVPAYRPLTAYMYAEGLARFGTDTYTLSDIHNPYRHLTNSSLNKTGPRYAECKERIGNGCKWTFKQVRRALIGRWGAKEWLVWQRIRALVTLTLFAQAAGTPPARNCFEFYGFDVLLDDCLKPWLLEVNLSPALASECDADATVKRPMLHELFDLLGLPMRCTGLQQLQMPVMAHSYNSEDESPVKEPARSTSHKGGQRRRRAMPLHCLTLQPPLPDKAMEPVEKFNAKIMQYGRVYKTDVAPEDTESKSSVISEGADESWRGGYSTAASRRKMAAACAWGNGVRWDRAVGRVGHWVRIYPHTLPNADQMPMDDTRENIAQVAKFLRAAREVSKEGLSETRDLKRDSIFEAALRKKLAIGPQFEVWLPPL